MLLISSMITCIIITIIQTNHFYVVSIIIYYIVILAILFGNFKIMKRDNIVNKLKKNKYINILIAEQERNRIGQDLHDTLGHVFASLSVKSELAAKLIDKDPIAAKKEILNINEISERYIRESKTYC